MIILSFIDQPRRKFVNIVVQRIAVLANQNNPILLLSVQAVYDNPVRSILFCYQLQVFNPGRAGSNLVGSGSVVAFGDIKTVKVEIFVIRFLVDPFDFFQV